VTTGARNSAWGVRAFATLIACSCACVATAAQAQPAQDVAPVAEPTPSNPPDELGVWLATQRDASGRRCDRRATQEEADRIAVACGDSGLWIVRRDPTQKFTLTETKELGGQVVGLFVRDGKLWVEILRLEARPVSDALSGSFARSPAPAPAPPVLPPPPVPVPPASPPKIVEIPHGKVVDVDRGFVVVDFGTAQSIRIGDRVELSVTSSEAVGRERALRKDILAIGVVTTVSERFSRIELGLGERVPLGAAAEPVARKPTASRVAPPRIGGLWDLKFMARPFFAIDEFGGGAVLDASIGYRFEAPFRLKFVVSPLGYANGENKPPVIPVSSFLEASYDRDLFGVGFGLGGQTVNQPDFGVPTGSGTLFVQGVRLGAQDGLNLELRSDVVLFFSEFRFSGMTGSAQIPIGKASWLILAGGAGTAGYGMGELGVRVLVDGNGDKGSTFLTGSVGGVDLFEDRGDFVCSEFECSDDIDYGGPMIGFGAEWRL
jgi:hypothetical protein